MTTLSATQTHDTKRGEDARARLAALARAREEVAGWRDDDRAAQRRARLFDDLVEEFGRQQETT